ncbi:MAG: SHOCT domain-containing protein [Actinobacteria bacterium]|nr:SHOCT domain-containing protein [Actinomycetota bacterium]
MIADVGLGELLWSLLVLYLIVHLLIVTFIVVMDLIRSDDLSGFAKAAWAVVLLFFPLLGLLAYLVGRGDGIGARNLAREQAALPPPPPAPASVTAELESAARLHEAGSLSDDEFRAIKAKLLS